ncbi:MAG: putative peptidoglycan glycosyltransferase FtsW [Candidatus Gracilibacteria bacterium]|nr:putative peptidoglycan glycosyltransferase FtsW [Candidatus Gracilibacteria bacterium]
MSKQVDYKLFFVVVALVVFGMIMISSVSVYQSFKVTSNMVKLGLTDEPYNYFYVIRNISHVVISFAILGILVKVPYTYFEKNARYIYYGSLVLMILVLAMGITLKGARGWISIPGIPFTIQPTEFLKFSFIIYLAYFFKKIKHKLHTFQDGFIPFLFILGTVVFLVGLQPDFGTIMLMVPVATLMFFVAGANVKYISMLVLSGFILIFTVYSIGDYDKTTGKNLNKLGYITQRIDNFLSDEKSSIENNTINYQTEQAIIAIGSGGFGGLGFGKSIQKFGYLPEVQGDFIFSVVIEELGFVGALVIICLYLYIGYRGAYIALRSKDLFAKYVAVGMTSRFIMQAFINMGVNLNIVPLTGITLPFISYGGSSLLTSIMGLAVVLNISRYIEQREFSTKSIGNSRKVMNFLKFDNKK